MGRLSFPRSGSAVVLHRVGEVFDRLELVAGDVSGRSAEQGRDAVDDRGAGVLDGRGLHDMELGLGLAEDLPIAHIAVVRAVDLADGLFLDGDALHGLDGDDRGHADGVAGLDVLAERFTVNVLVDDAGNMLLGNALDGEAELIADGFGGVPGVGRLKVGRVSDLRFKLFRRQVAAVGLGERDAVLVHVVAVSALDLRDVVAARRNETDHVDPEDILHAAAGDGAAVFLRKSVELVDHGRGGRPGVNGLFAGRDDVDAAGNALLDGFINVADEAAGRDDGDVGVALVEDLLRVIGNDDARLDAEFRPVADVLADGRAVADAADDLRAMLIRIAKGVLAHLSATILHNLNFIHYNSSFLCHKIL